jgi:hypothetical protein
MWIEYFEESPDYMTQGRTLRGIKGEFEGYL